MQKQDWNDLRYFLALSRHRTMAAAARALGVNQTTVFRRLNAMEDRLGVRLFERLPNGYLPTGAGESLLPAAERVEEEVTAAEIRLAGEDLRPSGTIRLTTTEDLMVAFLQPHIAGFRREYPQIRLEVVVGNLLFDITRREADIAIRPTDRPPEHLVGRNLGAIGWAVYGSGAYLRRNGAPGSPAQLAGHAIVTADQALAAIDASRWIMRHAGEQDVVFRSDSLLVQLGAVREGMGLAILPCFLADSDRRLERVLEPVKPADTGGCWILTHPQLRNVARVRAFMNYIAEVVAADRSRLAGTS
ncbi:MAG: LysR family transcriptional regulator [Gammaproteobacteria bacterium]|jgi:DNA-binding transcriptional LysR family regulator